MRVKLYSATLVCCFARGVAEVPAQKTRSAAKADSPVRGMVRDDVVVTSDRPEEYRAAINRLGFDYQAVLHRFELTSTSTHPPTFRNVVLAHLITRQANPSGSNGVLVRIIEAMNSGKSLRKSVELGLGVTPDEARRLKQAADKQLKSAQAK